MKSSKDVTIKINKWWWGGGVWKMSVLKAKNHKLQSVHCSFIIGKQRQVHTYTNTSACAADTFYMHNVHSVICYSNLVKMT